MKTMKIALIGGAVVAALSGMAVAACSNSTSPISGTGEDSGTQPATDSGTQPTTDSGTPTGDSGNGVTCGKPPEFFAPVADGGIYCPYSFNDATDAGVQYCGADTTSGQNAGLTQCCVSPSTDAGPSVCQAPGTCTQSTATIWQCSGSSDCANYYPNTDGGGGPVVCCLVAGKIRPEPSTDSHPGCTSTEGLDSVTCQAASTCTGTVVVGTYTDYNYIACQTQNDCIATTANGNDGGTCTGVYSSGSPIGLCL
ncbi:MAG: hypothetical protein ACLQVI_05110 [Polyangiaceae bacterium]